MTDNQKEHRSTLIARAIAAVGVAPTMRKRAEDNLAMLTEEEIVQIIERADDRRLRAQKWVICSRLKIHPNLLICEDWSFSCRSI
jgi:thymidylate kinase